MAWYSNGILLVLGRRFVPSRPLSPEHGQLKEDVHLDDLAHHESLVHSEPGDRKASWRLESPGYLADQ